MSLEILDCEFIFITILIYAENQFVACKQKAYLKFFYNRRIFVKFFI